MTLMMLAIDAKVTNNGQNVQLKVTKHSKQIFHKIYTVHQLKKQVQNNKASSNGSTSASSSSVANGCNFRGQKIPLQFADIYLGPDSTIQLNMNPHAILLSYNLIVYSGSRIYINNLNCNKFICKCQTIRFYGQNSCKQNVQFYYCMNNIQKQIYTKQGIICSKAGNLLIANNAKLYINAVIFSAGVQIRLAQNSQLKFINKKLSVFKAQKSTIHVDFQAKLYCQNNLTLFVQKIVNKGYISTTNQKNGVIFIQNKILDNFGHIKVPSLVLMTQILQNHSQGQISVFNGKIIVNKQLQNKGQLMIPSLTVGFNNQNTRAKVLNKGQLLCRNLLAQVEYFANSGSICCQQVKIQGKYQKNLLKNQSVIQCNKLQLLNIIFINTNTGFIISTGELQIFIEGWINSGQVQNKLNIYSAIKGSLFNKGCFRLNDAVISAKNVKNDNKISAHNQLTLNVKDLFVNAPQSSIEMPKLVILGKKVRNLGKIQVDQLDVESKMFHNQKSGKISANTTNSFGKYNYNSGQANFKRLNITADKLHNDGNFNAQAMNFQGGYIKNQNKMNVDSGKLNTKLNYSDTPEAQGTFKNVQMHTLQDPVFYTQGKLKFENVKLNDGIKHFFNKKQVDFEKVQLKLDGFSVKDLKMKDTHITFTTLKQQKDGKIYSIGGYNGLHQIQRRNSAPLHENQFQIDIISQALYKDLQIVCENQSQIAVGSINPYLNGWNLLTHPIGVGQFSKRITTKKFDIPGNIYDVNMKAKNFKKVTKLSPHLYEKYYTHQIPSSGQKQLTIQTDHLLLGGRFKYSSQKLTINVPNLDIKIGSLQVPDGVLQVNTQQAMIVTHAYMQAKGIELRSTNQISIQASKFCAAASGLLMDASKITILPTIQKKHTQSYSANGKVKWVNDWEEGCRSQFHVQGSIIIRADQYIQMIAPYIKAKQKLAIASPNTHIQGLFLYKNCDTFVKKKKMFGGSKTNQYGDRNDRPFPAFLQAQQIQFTGSAKVNATFKAKKIIDLTQNGLHLFYVIGYSGSFQNRQFSNFFTQGVQGYSHTRQKFLKANLTQVQMIIRDKNLPGQIIFDTVQWGKIKPIIQAKYKELIAIPKQWYTSWQHQFIGMGLIMIISMVAAYAGANILGPALVSLAGVAKAGIAAMAIKSSAAVICQKFAVTLAVTGNLDAAFKSVFSFDTVISAAINFGLDFAMMKLAKPLGISLVDKSFTNILKKKFLQFTLSSAASVIQGQQIGKCLLSGVKHMFASLVAQVGGNHIGSNYGFKSGFDYFIHKALHAALGAVQGFIIGGNTSSAISGAVGALVAEVVIQALVDRNDIAKAHKTSDNPQEMFEIQKLVAKIFGGVAGGLCGNFQVAMLTAVNAIHYNFETQLQAQLDQMDKNGDTYTKQMKKKKLQQEINDMLVEDARDVITALLSYQADQILSYQLYTKQMNDQGTTFFKIDPAKIQNGLKTKLNQFKQKFKHLKLDSYQIMFDRNVSYNMLIQGFSMKSQKQKKIFIGIAGSKNKHDFLINDNHINIKGKPLQSSIQQTRQYIRNIAHSHPNYDIKVTGHSLGGHLAQLSLLSLENSYKNISVTSFNAFHGFFRDINNDIIKNPKIKRFRMKNQWPLRHPMANFNPIIDAAKVGYNPNLKK